MGEFKDKFPLLWNKGEQEEITKQTLDGSEINVLFWRQEDVFNYTVDKKRLKEVFSKLPIAGRLYLEKELDI